VQLEHTGFDLDEPIRQPVRKFMNGGWRGYSCAA
jgi:hypothetical protein